MIVLRSIALVFLGILAAGFGLCAVTSAIFAIGAPKLLVLTVVMLALTWACVRGIKRLRAENDVSGAPHDKSTESPKND